MQTKPDQITATFAPEMQFNVELIARAALTEPAIPPESHARFRFVAAHESPEWRGIRFSALND